MAGFDLAKMGLKPQAGLMKASTAVAKPATEAPLPTPEKVVEAPKAAIPKFNLASIGVKAPVKAPVLVPSVVPKTSPAPAPTGTDLIPYAPIPEAEQSTILRGPAGFKEKLDKLDNLIVAGAGITQTTLDTCRHYVADVMMELRKFPEYDSILIDRDVHNVMMFVQQSTSQASKDFAKKGEAREKKASKAVAASQFDLSGLGDMTTLDKKPGSSSVISLVDLSSLNIDNIAAKANRGK